MPPSQMRSSVCSISSKKRSSPRPQSRPARAVHTSPRWGISARRAGRRGSDRTRRRSAAASWSSSCAPIVTLPAGRAWLGEPLHQRVAVLADLVRLLAKQPRNLAQHVDEGRPAVARGLREISAAPDRLALRRQEHGQRPAALLAEMMQRRHVDLIDVGALLAVDFDVDEQLVHHRGGVGVLEAFVRHDMAPVAGGVADREQDRLAGTLAPRRAHPAPTPTTRPGCACAATNTGWSRAPGDFPGRTAERWTMGVRSWRILRQLVVGATGVAEALHLRYVWGA